MADNEATDEDKKNSKLPLIIGLAVIVLGGAGFFLLGGDKETPKEEAVVVQDLAIVKLEKEITISFINDENQQHYLLINVSYLPSTVVAQEYLANKEPVVRQMINSYLLSLSDKVIKSSDGITIVKNKILSIMNKVLSLNENLAKEDTIKDVYIEKYIVQ